MKKNEKKTGDLSFREMERSAGKGLPGVFTAFWFKFRQRFLPVMLAACLALGTYFAISSELKSMAYDVDKLTIYSSCSERMFRTIYKVRAKKVGVNIDYEDFKEIVNVQCGSDRDQKLIAKRYQLELEDNRVPAYIVVTEENEVLNCYYANGDLAKILTDMIEGGYLEVTE